MCKNYICLTFASMSKILQNCIFITHLLPLTNVYKTYYFNQFCSHRKDIQKYNFKSNLKLRAKYLQNASFGIRIATHPNVVKKNILSVLLLTVANVWQMWHLPALLCV